MVWLPRCWFQQGFPAFPCRPQPVPVRRSAVKAADLNAAPPSALCCRGAGSSTVFQLSRAGPSLFPYDGPRLRPQTLTPPRPRPCAAEALVPAGFSSFPVQPQPVPVLRSAVKAADLNAAPPSALCCRGAGSSKVFQLSRAGPSLFPYVGPRLRPPTLTPPRPRPCAAEALVPAGFSSFPVQPQPVPVRRSVVKAADLNAAPPSALCCRGAGSSRVFQLPRAAPACSRTSVRG